MPHGSAATADTRPIAADAKLADALRDALNAYVSGDYRVAHERLLDALSLSRDRSDTLPLIAFTNMLGGLLADGSLIDFDPSPRLVDPRRV